MINQEIFIEENIVYQKNLGTNGEIHHNIKYKRPKDLNVAIAGKNKCFKGYFRIVLVKRPNEIRIGSRTIKDQVYFQFWVTNKDEEIEDYEIQSKYENVEIYFNNNDAIKLMEVALKKFKEINQDG